MRLSVCKGKVGDCREAIQAEDLATEVHMLKMELSLLNQEYQAALITIQKLEQQLSARSKSRLLFMGLKKIR
ncbi:hypothetical protein [Serratia sp. S119]|uniref:hypothetical protein n=1 Tax=Serratia sp. S119 TaxID=1118230 RepID=UPI0009C4D9DE|nr:hypothetical protein [Serratia sp. S119]ONK17850.1 hypothetical protein BHT35_3452 [Serratia sp. S119]